MTSFCFVFWVYDKRPHEPWTGPLCARCLRSLHLGRWLCFWQSLFWKYQKTKEIAEKHLDSNANVRVAAVKVSVQGHDCTFAIKHSLISQTRGLAKWVSLLHHCGSTSPDRNGRATDTSMPEVCRRVASN